MKNPYQPQKFEKKWQEYWERNKTYKSKNISGFKNKEKQYVLAMFPYPSGAGLHVGHVRNYTGTDVLARFFRMSGIAVLHPMGWDAFGLPAENAAVKAKVNPMDMVPGHIETFKKQMKSLGFSYDWDREFATIDPKYYRWTQWLFIQFFKMGLLYKRNAPINYCPKCKTGLAEEEVLADGTHERCGHKIVKKDLPQWIFRITEYAERLLSELEGLDWPEGILAMQRNWIGKKEGINIDYKIVDGEVRHRDLLSTSPPKGGSPKSLTKNQVSSLPAIDTITCFTTRPDTNFGATFIVVAPEHPFVKKIIGGELKSKEADVKKIREYVEKAASKSEMERQAEGRKKTGVFTGFYAVNNLNGRKMPIWVSDFALMNFGTGAVVGVPGHDIRDFEFAHGFGIEVIRVVKGKDGDLSSITKVEQVQEEEGTMVNSGFLDGMDIHKATVKVMDWFEEKGYGKRVVSYHLRDWIFSRQRYWGEPIPMVYCEKCAKEGKSYFDTEEGKKFIDENSKIIGGRVDEVREGLKGWFPLSEKDLPLELPYLKSYEPPESGESPLSQVDSFVKAKCPNCGSEAKRETDTMPNWAGSCWYFLAFPFWNKDVDSARPIFATQESHPASRGHLESEKTVHASLSKRVSSSPNMSMKDEWLANKNLSEDWTPVDWYLGGAEHAVLHLLYSRFWVKVLYDMRLLDFKEPFLRLRNQGMVLAEDHRKMSKSFGNVINPDDVVKEYGADALRIYEMFMAPFNAEIPWSTKA
ncbi:leucine--tRNA ligase, partial [Patescibacteria group bacterium]|nr:leucine--tRNA ligase [Patescibacteria group bacterium]